MSVAFSDQHHAVAHGEHDVDDPFIGLNDFVSASLSTS